MVYFVNNYLIFDILYLFSLKNSCFIIKFDFSYTKWKFFVIRIDFQSNENNITNVNKPLVSNKRQQDGEVIGMA